MDAAAVGAAIPRRGGAVARSERSEDPNAKDGKPTSGIELVESGAQEAKNATERHQQRKQERRRASVTVGSNEIGKVFIDFRC
jgi:hypothetical protein